MLKILKKVSFKEEVGPQEAPAKVFFSEFCEIFKKTNFV